jgi:hypothetical protein
MEVLHLPLSCHPTWSLAERRYKGETERLQMVVLNDVSARMRIVVGNAMKLRVVLCCVAVL